MSERCVILSIFFVIICCIAFYYTTNHTAQIQERKIFEGLNRSMIEKNDAGMIKKRPVYPTETVDYRSKMILEYPNYCYTIQIFYITRTKFEKHRKLEIQIINNNFISDIMSNPGNIKKQSEHEHHMEQQRNQPQNKKVDNIHGSNSIIYVFVLFLIASLIRAALDISKHFSKQDKNKDDFSRRTSLQEFAQSRHSRKNSKKKSVSRQESIMTPVGSPIISKNSIINNFLDNPSQFLLNKILIGTAVSKDSTACVAMVSPKPHIGNSTTNNSSFDRLESGSPTKIQNKLSNGRPAPMMRRQSVPCAVGQSIFSNTYGSLARRPSMDSFSEGDSSPDVKRRVRMLHRH